MKKVEKEKSEKRSWRREMCAPFQTNCRRRLLQILYATVTLRKKQLIEWKRVFGKQVFCCADLLQVFSSIFKYFQEFSSILKYFVVRRSCYKHI